MMSHTETSIQVEIPDKGYLGELALAIVKGGVFEDDRSSFDPIGNDKRGDRQLGQGVILNVSTYNTQRDGATPDIGLRLAIVVQDAGTNRELRDKIKTGRFSSTLGISVNFDEDSKKDFGVVRKLVVAEDKSTPKRRGAYATADGDDKTMLLAAYLMEAVRELQNPS